MNNTKQQNNKGNNSGSNLNTSGANTASTNIQGNGNRNNQGNGNRNNRGNGNNNIKINNNNNIKPINNNTNKSSNVREVNQSPIVDFFTPGNTSNTTRTEGGFFSLKNILYILLGLVIIAGLSLGIYYLVKYFKNKKEAKRAEAEQAKLVASASKSNEVEAVEEVFHVRANKYTYDDAEAVCKALDAKLATREQLIDAHSKGANWCSYGWVKSSDGQPRAFYPIQPEFWNEIQNSNACGLKDKCGVPGINGGAFDRDVMFGVNCYGVKRGPTNEEKELTNTLCSADLETNEKVAQYKSELANTMFSPFAQGKWSGNE